VVARTVDEYAGRNGKADAEVELAAGRLAFLETGPQVSWDSERHEIARTKYQVELRHLEGSTESFVRYVESFNRVMKPQIVNRHGRAFFDTLHQEAIAAHEARPKKA
jgi:hypothetical protein